MQAAVDFAEKYSDDPDTQVGAVVVRNRTILASGTNRLPPGVERLPERLCRPEKYNWLIHAEQDAIAGAKGDLTGARMYVTLFPCNICAQNIVKAEIGRLIAPEPDMTRDSTSHYTEALQLLKDAGVEIHYYDMDNL